MNAKKHRIIGVLLIGLTIYAFYHGWFIYPKGALLCSYNQAYTPKYHDGIYMVPFDRLKPVELFFRLDGYGGYDYPFIQDGKFFCRGFQENEKNKAEKRDSVLFMVDDYKNNIANKDAVQILMTVPGFVQSPIVTKDLSKIYYKKEDKLYAFERERSQEQQVNEDKIEVYSNLLLSKEQNVIYTKHSIQQEDDRYINKYTIVELYPNGETKVLIEDGRYPAWYEKDKSIIYSSDKSTTYIYDLVTGEKEDLGPDHWAGSPMVSPDKKYLLVRKKNPDAAPGWGNEAWFTYFITRLHSVEMKKIRKEGNDYNGVPCWLEE